MRDWNVVVTVRDRRFRQALEALAPLGAVQATEFYNVLVMRVEDARALLEALRQRMRTDPAIAGSVAHLAPVEDAFVFQSAEQFEAGARAVLMPRLDMLRGRSFHMRVHRRGFKGRLSGRDEEQRLARFVVDRLAAGGSRAQVRFDDPDYVVVLEIVGQRAGVVFWSRADRDRYPFVSVD
ncbi:MAG: THUMP domain-containing protein [Gammaproteobacteria bacterium]